MKSLIWRAILLNIIVIAGIVYIGGHFLAKFW